MTVPLPNGHLQVGRQVCPDGHHGKTSPTPNPKSATGRPRSVPQDHSLPSPDIASHTPRHWTSRSWRTVKAGWSLISWAGDGGSAGGESSLENTGLIWETWKEGWMQRERGSSSRTTTGLITFEILKRPMNLAKSFFDLVFNGISLVENQTD